METGLKKAERMIQGGVTIATEAMLTVQHEHRGGEWGYPQRRLIQAGHLSHTVREASPKALFAPGAWRGSR